MTSVDAARPPKGTPAESSSGAQSIQILQSDASWNGTPYESYPHGVPQLTVVRYRIAARSSLPWHRQHMPNTAFVLSGHMVLMGFDGSTKVFGAGQAFAESVGNEHRGFTEDEGVEIVCTYAGVDGESLSVPTGRSIE